MSKGLITGTIELDSDGNQILVLSDDDWDELGLKIGDTIEWTEQDGVLSFSKVEENDEDE